MTASTGIVGGTESIGYTEGMLSSAPEVSDTDWYTAFEGTYDYQIEAIESTSPVVSNTEWVGQSLYTYRYKLEGLHTIPVEISNTAWVQYLQSSYTNWKPEGVVSTSPLISNTSWT